MSESTTHVSVSGKRVPCTASKRACPRGEHITTVDKQTPPRSTPANLFAEETVLSRRTISKTSADATTLTNLAREKDIITRIGVATNSQAPAAVLHKLSKDKDWGVRAAIAANPSTSPADRETLKTDDNSWVKAAASKN